MSDSDELSIADIIAVLLRFRKLVIGLPVILTALLSIYFYLFPIIGVKRQSPQYHIQFSASLNLPPAELKDYVGLDIADSLNSYFSSVPLESAVFSKYFPKVLASQTDEEKMTYIKTLLGSSLKYSMDTKAPIYTLSFSTRDREQGKAYLTELWTGAVANLMDRLRASVTAELVLLEQSGKEGLAIAQVQNTAGGNSSMANIRQGLLALQANPNFPFYSKPELVITLENRERHEKYLLLTFFGSLCFAVIGAFVLQAIRNIKNDPESMAKIRAALNEGRKKA